MSNEVSEQKSSKHKIIRRFTSIILALAFFILTITGVQMDLTHTGGGGGRYNAVQGGEHRNAEIVSAPRGLRQEALYPKKAHKWAGYIFIVAGCVHLFFNTKAVRAYIRAK